MPGVDRASLEQERDFLLASLRDLEAEHEAGDIEDLDYEGLRDDYTARTAAVLRALDGPSGAGRDGIRPRRVSGAGGPAERDKASPAADNNEAAESAGGGEWHDASREAIERSRRRWRTAAIVTAIVVVGVLAAWAVTASSGARLANQPISGSFAGKGAPGGTTATGASGLAGGASAGTTSLAGGFDPRLTQAAQLVQKGKITDALKLYDQVLKDRPNDPTALASEGWLIAQAGMAANRSDLVDQGLVKIAAGERSDPSYPTAHFFRGSLLFQAKGDPAGAVTELRTYLGLVSPTAPEVPQVEQLLNAAIAAAGPNVPSGPNAPTATAP